MHDQEPSREQRAVFERALELQKFKESPGHEEMHKALEDALSVCFREFLSEQDPTELVRIQGRAQGLMAPLEAMDAGIRWADVVRRQLDRQSEAARNEAIRSGGFSFGARRHAPGTI